MGPRERQNCRPASHPPWLFNTVRLQLPGPLPSPKARIGSEVQNPHEAPLLHDSTCHLIRKADFHERRTCSVHTISTFSPHDRVTGFTVSHFPTTSFGAGFGCADTNQRSIFTDFTIKRTDTPKRQTLPTKTSQKGKSIDFGSICTTVQVSQMSSMPEHPSVHPHQPGPLPSPRAGIGARER